MKETLERVASRIEEYLRSSGRNLEFRVDESTGRTVITVRDARTGDMIRQIPGEEALQVAHRLGADSGTLIDQLV